MSRHLALAAILVLAGCSTTDSSPTAPASVAPSDIVDCGDVTADTCREVADAARMMLGTSPLVVEALELPEDEDGLQMVERYLVRLEPDAVGDDLVEVVRFSGNDNWSVRRAPVPSGDS